MSTLTVETGWIIGTPDSASQLVSKVVGWVTLNTAWNPDEAAWKDIESLRTEIMTVYDIPNEGYCAFATQIIDSVLNRLYPYLITYSRDSGAKISSDRKKGLDAEQTPIVEYTIEAAFDGEPVNDDNGEPLPNIEGNPFPKPGEIADSTVTPIPGTPQPEYSPVYPGLPYNPLDPFSRELNPYPARNEQPNIPYSPGDTNVPGSPITERPTYEAPSDSYIPLIDSLPRAGEISLEGIPKEGSEKEKPNEENPPSEEKPPTEEEPAEPEIPDELIPLLKRILYEIENQGTLTRESLAAGVLSITASLLDQSKALQSSMGSAEELLEKVIENNGKAQQGLLQSILDELKEAQGEPESTLDSLLSLLGESLDEVGELLESGYKAVRNAVETGLETVGNALGAMGSLLEAGFESVSNAVENGLEAVSKKIEKGGADFMSWLGAAFEFSPDDFSKYLCQFLTAIESCKDCNYLNINKGG